MHTAVAFVFLCFAYFVSQTNGFLAKEKEFPYIASLRLSQDNTHFCVGSILHSKWVLTAASCFHDGKKIFRNADHVVVYANTLESRGTKGTQSTVEKLILHPSFHNNPNQTNVALLHLSKSIYWFWQPPFPIFFKGIKPIKIGRVGVETIVVGLGWYYSDQVLQPELSYEELVTRDNGTTCVNNFQTICTVNMIEERDCLQDGGMPIVDRNGRTDVLVGIVLEQNGCGSRVFIRLDSYISWIEGIAGISVSSLN